jgi:hypothetical protein
MKKVNAINNITLHYARLPQYPYGTSGKPYNFYIEDSFLKLLETAFKDVFIHCPLGRPDIITSAGTLVGKAGEHGSGKAFDLDAIFWKDHQLITNNYIHQKELYLGIESFLRKHFGLVLNYHYPNHTDHWHVDSSVSVDYNESSKSETFYLQMVLKDIYQKPVVIDGISGPQTRRFTKEVFGRLKIDTPITTKKNYLKFLDITGKIAFKLSEEQQNPLQLLENLEVVINRLPVNDKHQVNEALNAFLVHHTTSTWINNIQPHQDIDNIIDTIIT